MLSVLIVNWNNKDLLKKCLTSIYQYTLDFAFEVIVCDNNSTDGAAEMVIADFPQVKLIKNPVNSGFAKGNNIAYRASRGEYILYLNQDTEINSNIFPRMVDSLTAHPEIGILGPKLLNTDGTLQKSCRRFPTLISQVLILLKVHNVWLNFQPIKNYYMADFQHDKIAEVDQVMGACLLTRREIVDKIGGFSEDYPFWFEEVDFCLKVKDLGWQIVFNPNFSLYHHKGASIKFDPKRQKRFILTLQIYFRKNKPYWQYLIIKLFSPLAVLLWYIGLVPQRLGIIKKNREL